jgi:3-hydroxyisobutyrate dehydrogenase
MATVGFIGLGNMGAPMVANLVKAGHRVKGFDLNAEACEAGRKAGAEIAASAGAAAQDADCIITMLPAGKHVLGVYGDENGVMKHAPKGALFIDCSTIDVDSARKAHQLAEVAGMQSLDSPVSGGVVGATAGTLTFMVGGTEAAFTRGQDFLKVMGARMVHCGAAGAGQAAKICNNMILGISMTAVCEGIVLAEKLGLSHKALFDVVSTSSGSCWSINKNSPMPGMVEGAASNNNFRPGFMADLMLKDLTLAVEAAKSSGAACELGDHARKLYEAFSAAGHGGLDFSAMVQDVRKRSE